MNPIIELQKKLIELEEKLVANFGGSEHDSTFDDIDTFITDQLQAAIDEKPDDPIIDEHLERMKEEAKKYLEKKNSNDLSEIQSLILQNKAQRVEALVKALPKLEGLADDEKDDALKQFFKVNDTNLAWTHFQEAINLLTEEEQYCADNAPQTPQKNVSPVKPDTVALLQTLHQMSVTRGAVNQAALGGGQPVIVQNGSPPPTQKSGVKNPPASQQIKPDAKWLKVGPFTVDGTKESYELGPKDNKTPPNMLSFKKSDQCSEADENTVVEKMVNHMHEIGWKDIVMLQGSKEIAHKFYEACQNHNPPVTIKFKDSKVQKYVDAKIGNPPSQHNVSIK